RFLSEGNKARLVVIFRGREIVHPETGQAMLKKVVELTSDIAMVEQPPMMEGRRMLMIISPRGGVINRPVPTTGTGTVSAGAPSPSPSPSSPQPQSAAPAPKPVAPTPKPAPQPKPAPTVSVKPPAK
ncbi:MAG TPA: translation initiation factor IF-3 C-terminal domain-containing protein, partial [Polyangia bacterium]